MSFIAMNVFGVDANIMSLAGIAIAIGTMVDMGIIVSENIYGHLAEWETNGSPGGEQQRQTVINDAACEVAPLKTEESEWKTFFKTFQNTMPPT